MLSTGGDPPGPGPARIAVWGTFDVDNYGDHLFPRVAARELGRRLPGAVVTPFSPYGWLHPTALDGGRAAAPLGPWSPGRAAQLAAAHHLVLVGGGELIHLCDPMLATVYGASTAELDHLAPSRFFVEGLGPELEADCPVVWHGLGVPWTPGEEGARRLRAALAARPYVTVRDRHSAQRLAEAGVDRPVEVVPDSALLLERLLGRPMLERRLDRLRAVDAFPGPESAALVVQGCDLLIPHVDAMVAAVRAWQKTQFVPLDVVVVETGRCRGDAAFAAAFERALAPERAWRLPAGVPVEDLAAAITGGALFLGSSLHGAITALAYGRPFVLLNLIEDNKLDGFGDLTGLDRFVLHFPEEIPAALDAALSAPSDPARLAGLCARIDRHFDRIAEMAAERAAARPDVGPVVDLAAYAVADHVARLGAETAALREELAVVRAGAARTEAELSAMQATKTFRFLGPARDLYGRLRRSS